MSKVIILGHFAYEQGRVDGQIVRTRIVRAELAKHLGDRNVACVDTCWLSRRPIRTWFAIARCIGQCSDAVIMPGERGLQWLLPWYLRWQAKQGFRIHYLVVGGWLPDYLAKRPQDIDRLKYCDGIHVQTARMVEQLEALGLDNVARLSNFRAFPHHRPRSQGIAMPLKLVYLSRVMPQKGVDLAVQAVESINYGFGTPRLILDIWGPVPPVHKTWFQNTLSRTGPDVQYRGVLEPDDIPTILAGYDIMVFPTWYVGEGFPGAIVDAFISGLPVIASDWQDNREFIEHGVNGLIFRTRDVQDLIAQLRWALDNPHAVLDMKRASAAMADEYHVDRVIPALIEKMGLNEAQQVNPEAPLLKI